MDVNTLFEKNELQLDDLDDNYFNNLLKRTYLESIEKLSKEINKDKNSDIILKTMLNLKLKNTKNEFRDTKLELNVFTPMSPFKENKLKEEFKNSSEKIKRSANELNNNNSAKKTNSSLKKNNKENINLTFSSIIQNH